MSVEESPAGGHLNGLARARDAFDRGELDTAREHCAAHLTAEPADAGALMLMGRILKSRSQFEEAIPLLERSAGIEPNAKALASLADCLLRVGRLEEGLHHIERVIAAYRDNVEALLLKAAILHAQRQFEAALECVRSAGVLAPGSHLVAARSGCILAELGQYEAAEKLFRDAARLSDSFRHCGLINFRQSVWRQIAPQTGAAEAEEFAALRTADVHAPYDAVVMACCDAQYFYKYGVTFVNSYAQNAARSKLLHLHVLDPDEGFAGYLETLIARVRLRNIAVTYEYAPIDEAPDFNLRRTFYSCARFLRMSSLLAHYRATIACFDIDTVFEAPVDDMLARLSAVDVGLIEREPADSPWLDIVANVVIARDTAAARRYFSAVGNFIRHFVGRGKLYWHLDQIALYCVLKMMQRFDVPPRVGPLALSARAAVWHIGNPYAYRLKESRVARYQLDGMAPQPGLP
jgi:tetratricopeptide (TPR) repeat protein